jgi:hypothetical protein
MTQPEPPEVPQCCKLRPSRQFMLKATIYRVIRVRPKLTVRHRHSKACSMTARQPPTDPHRRPMTRLRTPTSPTPYVPQTRVGIPKGHLPTTTTRPSLSTRRTSMRSNRSSVRSNVKSARMPRRFTARRPATTANPRETTNQPRTRKPTTLYRRRYRSRASRQTSGSMRLRQSRCRRRNPSTAKSRNCRNRPHRPRKSQHS